MIDGWIPFINLAIGLSFVDPINKYGYADSFLYQFDTRQDCSMLTVPKLLVVGLKCSSLSKQEYHWQISNALVQHNQSAMF